MLGDLTIQEIETVLHSELIGRIGCHTDTNKMFVVPITYVYKDGYIYGHSREGKKIHMMRENPNVCFEVDVMKDLTHWQSVILWGEFEEIVSEEDKMNVLKLLTDRLADLEASETMMKPSYHLPNPHPHNAGVKAIAFRIKVEEKTGRFEQNP